MKGAKKNVSVEGILGCEHTCVVFLGQISRQAAFDSNVTKRVQYIISPLVLQELLLISDELGKKDTSDWVDRLLSSRHLAMTQFDVDSVNASVERIRRLRNRVVHANDLLNIQAAATTADYFLTQDRDLLSLREVDAVEVISPEQFFTLIKKAA